MIGGSERAVELGRSNARRTPRDGLADNPAQARATTRPASALSSSPVEFVRLRANAVNWPRHDQIELLPVATCVYGVNGVILDYNTRAEDFWGRSPLRGDPHERYSGFLLLYRPQGGTSPRECSPAAHALARGERVRDFELTVESQNGSRYTLLVNVELLRDESEQIVGAIECFHDMSGWTQMTEALNETKAIETLQRFAGQIGHEYANLLATTASNLGMARRRSHAAEINRFIDAAIRSTEKGGLLTKRLAAYARKPAGALGAGWESPTALEQEFFADIRLDADRAPVTAAGPIAVLVEDDAGLRAVARDALSSLGFGVMDADGGQTALDMVRADSALNLAVVDVDVAPTSGLDFLHQARQLRPGMKALLMTGAVGLPADALEQDGNTVILRKPFGLDQLAAGLQQLLG